MRTELDQEHGSSNILTDFTHTRKYMLHNHYNRKFHKKQKRGVQGLEEGAGISLFNECSFSVRNDENISGMGKNATCTAYVLNRTIN